MKMRTGAASAAGQEGMPALHVCSTQAQWEGRAEGLRCEDTSVGCPGRMQVRWAADEGLRG